MEYCSIYNVKIIFVFKNELEVYGDDLKNIRALNKGKS